MPLLSIAFVYLRFYVRLRVRRAYIGIDDWLILLSIFLVIGQSVIQILGTHPIINLARSREQADFGTRRRIWRHWTDHP